MNKLTYCAACYMPAFYVLSGYTFKDTPDILTKRFKQLIIPYAIWCLVYYTCFLIVSACRGDIEPLQWLTKLIGCFYSRCDIGAERAGSFVRLFPPGAGPLWFLTSLFTAYALYLPLHRTSLKGKCSILLTYVLLMLLFHKCPILLPWSIDTAFAGALFIFSGQMIKRAGILNTLSAKSLLYGLILLPIYIWIVNNNGGSGRMFCRDYGKLGWYAPILFIIMGVSGTYLWCLTTMILEKLHLAQALSYVGKYSLNLLCVHMLFYMTIVEGVKYISTLNPHIGLIENITPYTFVIQVTTALAVVFIHSHLRKS